MTTYMHIQDPEERRWLQDRIEVPHPRAEHDEQMAILSRLNVAEAFEMFLQTKFVGQRRFSLEGAESLIPLLDAVLAEAAREHLDEAVIGMPPARANANGRKPAALRACEIETRSESDVKKNGSNITAKTASEPPTT